MHMAAGIERTLASAAIGHRQDEAGWAMGGSTRGSFALALRKYGGAGNTELLILMRAVIDEAEVLWARGNWHGRIAKAERSGTITYGAYHREIKACAVVVVGEVLSARLCDACEGHGAIRVGEKLMPCPFSDEAGFSSRSKLRCVDGIRPWGNLRRAREAGISEGTFRRKGWMLFYRELLSTILRWDTDIRERFKMRSRED